MLHRNTLRALSIALSAVGLFALTLPAAHAKPGGKKPVGEILSYDAATGALTVDMVDGEDFTGTVADDAKVKIEHRGNHPRGKGHKKPSNGDLADLVAGTKVLRMKVDDGEVEKIRIRPSATSTAAAESDAMCAETLDDETDADETDADGELEATEADDDCDDDADSTEDAAADDDSDDSDDESDDSDGSDDAEDDSALETVTDTVEDLPPTQ